MRHYHVLAPDGRILTTTADEARALALALALTVRAGAPFAVYGPVPSDLN